MAFPELNSFNWYGLNKDRSLSPYEQPNPYINDRMILWIKSIFLGRSTSTTYNKYICWDYEFFLPEGDTIEPSDSFSVGRFNLIEMADSHYSYYTGRSVKATIKDPNEVEKIFWFKTDAFEGWRLIKDIYEKMIELNQFDSFKCYDLQQENEELKKEIARLKNNANM